MQRKLEVEKQEGQEEDQMDWNCTNVAIEERMREGGGKSEFKCNRCLKSFKRKYDRNRHEKNCTEVVRNQCHICGRMIVNRNMHRHRVAEQKQKSTFIRSKPTRVFYLVNDG